MQVVQKTPEYGIYHFSDGKAMTWFDFAKKIIEEHKGIDSSKVEKAKNYRTFAVRPKNSILQKNKL